MDDIRSLLLQNSMAGQAQNALTGRQRTLNAAEAAAVAPGAQPAAPQAPPQGGMPQSQFSGYGGQPASPQQKMAQQQQLIQMLRKRQMEDQMMQGQPMQ